MHSAGVAMVVGCKDLWAGRPVARKTCEDGDIASPSAALFTRMFGRFFLMCRGGMVAGFFINGENGRTDNTVLSSLRSASVTTSMKSHR
jgi:hypothetical protein